MHLQESGEMYIETIYVLSQSSSFVRAIDVGEKMGFSKPSVSVYLKNLRLNEYIDIDGNGYITLTDKGLTIASKISERHEVLSNMLILLGVSKETALVDACKMEHAISDESFDAIKKHLNQYPR